MSEYFQTEDELVNHLREQVQFLFSSSMSFDSGIRNEAKRLATVIRVLLHDTNKSASLLRLLNKKKDLDFHSTLIPFNPKSVITYSGLNAMLMPLGGEATYVAPLDFGSPIRYENKRVTFNVWWSGTFIFRDKNKKTFTRKDIVLHIANKEGGAHVDPKLDEAYASLSRFNSLNWKIVHGAGQEKDIPDNPAVESMRQIAHEAARTFRDELDKLFPAGDPILADFDKYFEHCKNIKFHGALFDGPEAVVSGKP